MEKPTDQPREAPPGGGGGREPSDRWDFTSVPPPQGDLIPQLKEIPETPEERKRRRIVMIVSAVLAAIAVVVAILIFLSIRHASRIESAVKDYTATGAPEALGDALDLLEAEDEPERQAVRAWLLANAALELGQADAAKTARETIDGLEGEPPGVAIAETYLALAQGQPAGAQKQAATIALGKDYPAEAAHAQALAAEAVGALPQALALANAAVEEQPEAPRQVALLALLLAKTGKAKDGMAKLDGLPEDAAAQPVARVAKARLALRMGDLDAAAEAADAVLAAEGAAPTRRAWAELARAFVAVSRGDAAKALALAKSAAVHRPPVDEDFVLWRGRVLLWAGDVAGAQKELERLPDGVTGSPTLRTHVVAELALARGKPASAAKALAGAPPGGRTSLLRGRVAEAQGKSDEAEALYRKAAEDRHVAPEALAALSRLLLDQGHPKEAVEAASKARTADPADADAVTAFVRAKLAAGDRKGALAGVSQALKKRGGDGRLLAAEAAVQMAGEQWKDARATLEKATALKPRDADLFAQLGEARRRLGDRKGAKEAFDRALALAPHHPLALTGMLQVAVAEHDLDLAKKMIDRIDETDIESLDVDRAEARYYVLAGAGQDGVGTVRHAIIKRGMHDFALWMDLARLQMQAGQPRQAVSSYARALGEKENDLDALLGKALAQLYMHAKGVAERTLDDVAEQLQSGSPSKTQEADYWAAKARLALLDDNVGGALQLARKALEIDAHNPEANLALADIEDERDRSPVDALRAALKAPIPPPEAKGRLAIELESGKERCDLADAYRDAAPRGPYMNGVRRVLRDCR